MFVGSLAADLHLGDVRSLKQKRSQVRPIVAEVRRRFDVSAAESDHHDLYQRAEIGIAVVSGDTQVIRNVLDGVERMLAQRPEVELLSVHRRLFSDRDE